MEDQPVPQSEQYEEVADLIMGEDHASDEPQEEEVAEAPEVEETDEAEEEAEEKPEEKAEDIGGDPIVEVEWEGQLIEAPKSVAEALMRQSDYTQKTQEVSAQRKEFEILTSDAKQRMDQFNFAEQVRPDIMRAEQLETQAQQYYDYMRENVGTIATTDIDKVRFEREALLQERQQIIESLQTKTTEFQQAQEQSHTDLLNKGTEILRQKIPGWGEVQQKQVRDYAVASGFTDAEMGSIVDPRQVETLWKAAQYDALKAGQAPAIQKVQSAPTIKTKARNAMPQETRKKLDLGKKLKSNKLSAREKRDLVAEDLGERWG